MPNKPLKPAQERWLIRIFTVVAFIWFASAIAIVIFGVANDVMR